VIIKRSFFLAIMAFWPLASHAALSKDTAISVGSFFAAAAQCEDRKLIAAGQTKSITRALSRLVSAADKKLIEVGYQRGARESSIYVVQQKQWVTFIPNEAGCHRVRGVLDDYKAQLLPS
jgi:thiazole synthase ThiGH ThiG subunit